MKNLLAIISIFLIFQKSLYSQISDCVCTTDWEPVCAYGQLYGNSCEAMCAGASSWYPMNFELYAPTPICKGDSIFIDAWGSGETYSYNWNTGDITPYIFVSPETTTTYFATALIHFCGHVFEVGNEITIKVNPVYIKNIDSVIFIGTSYIVGDHEYYTSGIYYDTLSTINGCDSIIITNLTVNSTFSISESVAICFGQSYILPDGSSTTTAGTYIDSLQTVNGYDSIITTILTIKYSTSSTINKIACNTYFLNGITYAASGEYSQTLSNASGCDSVITLNLIINPNPIANSTASTISCNGSNSTITVYSIGGTPPYTGTGTYTAIAGTYIFTVTDANGCSASTSVDVVWVGPCDTKLRAIDCGSTINNLNQAVYCNVVNGATDYELEFTATDFLFTRTKGNSNPGFRLNWITGIEYDKTYNVRARAYKNGVWGNFSTTCQITTGTFPFTKLRADFCGLSVSTFNKNLYCDAISGAVDYEWEFVNTESAYSFNRTRGIASPSMLLSWITGLEYGKTYDVRIKAKVGSQWGNYGTVCQITTPVFPATKVRTEFCGITVTSFTKYFYCDQVNKATDYDWEFVESVSGTTIIKTRGSNSPSMNLNIATGIQNGKTYNVRVRAKIENQWGSFGSVCQITAPGGSLQKNIDDSENNFTVKESNLKLKSSNLELSLIPNPVGKGNLFALVMQSDKNLNVCKINVYNIIGQIVYTKQLKIDANYYSLNIEQNEKFSTGLHIVQVKINDVVSRMKLIVE